MPSKPEGAAGASQVLLGRGRGDRRVDRAKRGSRRPRCRPGRCHSRPRRRASASGGVRCRRCGTRRSGAPEGVVVLEGRVREEGLRERHHRAVVAGRADQPEVGGPHLVSSRGLLGPRTAGGHGRHDEHHAQDEPVTIERFRFRISPLLSTPKCADPSEGGRRGGRSETIVLVLRLYDYAGLRELLQGAPPARPARPPVRARPAEHLRGRVDHGREPGRDPAGRTPVLELHSGGRSPSRTRSSCIWARARCSSRRRSASVRVCGSGSSSSRTSSSRMSGRGASGASPAAKRSSPTSSRRGWESARAGLDTLDRGLAGRRFLLGETYTVADISLYAYAHVAGDARIEMGAYGEIGAWLRRVEFDAGVRGRPRAVPAGSRRRRRRPVRARLTLNSVRVRAYLRGEWHECRSRFSSSRRRRSAGGTTPDRNRLRRARHARAGRRRERSRAIWPVFVRGSPPAPRARSPSGP